MSLLNKNNAFSVRDYLFVALGLLGLFWFFLSYSSNDPRSIIDTSLDKHSAGVKAIQTLHNLGYRTENLAPRASFKSNHRLLDSLQADLGRPQMIQTFKSSSYSGLYPYFWEVRFSSSKSRSVEEDQEPHFILRLSQQGKLVEFGNPENILASQQLHRKALIAAFETDSTLKLWTSLPDSVWDRVLSFNLERDYNAPQDSLAKDDEREKTDPHKFSKEEIKRLAKYHLKQGGWNPDKLQLTDIQIVTVKSNTAAELEFKNSEPYLGQSVKLDMTVLPTGTLLELNATYNDTPSGNRFGNVMEIVRTILVLLFALATLIIFYFRIRSRTVDTKPALVVSVLGGLMVPATILLDVLNERVLFGADVSDTVGTALQMGFAGAFATIGFFVMFAVGDSIMRQYWPEKLTGYDYLRQGMVFNKPIGEILVRSLVVAFLLCGFWTTVLYFFPNLYFDAERSLLTYESVWPPVHLFLNSGWYSLIMVLGIFAVLGTQVYGYFKNVWAAAFSMVLGIGLMCPVVQGFGPSLQEVALFSIFGILFTVVFLKWDFLTTLMSHFIFICMLQVASGWIIPHSPDLYIFITFCVFLLLLGIVGVFAIVRGKESKSLPNFVPEYVEELAQEQRIKQELEIARDVQQSFLPVQTPEFESLELAAICKPAYETGGDYYDFVRLDENRVAVMIGDVSGKGIQAAFFMTFIKGILHSLCREIDSPAEILKKTNRLFCDNAPRSTFISLVYGIIDLEKQVFHFARAGHNPILRIRSANESIEELQPRGIGIGLTRTESFDQNIEEVELEFTGEDVLVLYTDGIVEALNKSQKFYGTHRLNNLLMKNKELSAADILNEVSQDLRSYIGEAKQHDDMTMVVMKLKKQ